MTANAGTAIASIHEPEAAGRTRGWPGSSSLARRWDYGDDEPTTGDLARAAARAETLAWTGLVRRFDGLVRGIARAHGLNEADAADVCQAVWIRLVTKIDCIRQPDRLAGWLATTARYESIRVLQQRQRSIPTTETDVLDTVNDTDDPSVHVGDGERDDALRQQIETLPHQYRRLLAMLLCDPQPTYREISDALAMPLGSIGPTRQRCLALLRSSCASAGLTPSTTDGHYS